MTKRISHVFFGLTAAVLGAGCSDVARAPLGPDTDRIMAAELAGGAGPVERLDLEYVHLQIDGQGDGCIVGNNGSGNYGGAVTFAAGRIRQMSRFGTRNIFLNYNVSEVFFRVRLDGRTYLGTAAMVGTGDWELNAEWEPGDNLPYQDIFAGGELVQSGPTSWSSHAKGLLTHELVGGALVDVPDIGAWCSLAINYGQGGTPVFNSVVQFDGGVQDQGNGKGHNGKGN